MEILDADGKVDQDADGHGARRAERHQLGSALDAPKLVELLTTPPENPHIWEEPRFKDVADPPDHPLGHHAADRHPDGGARASTRCASRSTAQRYTQPFEVMKDPAIATSVEDLQTSTTTQMRIRDDITETSDDGQQDGGLAEADRRSA